MANGLWRLFRTGICLTMPVVLSGCVAAALAPVVPLVGGMLGNKSQVIIDESTVDPQLREFLPTASNLAILSQDPTAVYAAEHMETHSDFEVTLVAPPQAVSPSQARRFMSEVCEREENPDLVLYFNTPQSDAGTGTTVKGVVTGRSKFNLDLATDVLRCEDGWRTQFTTTGAINQGIYNADQAKINQILGQEFSLALLQLAGKVADSS